MYIVVDKKTGKFVRDTGTVNNVDVTKIYNNLLNNIDNKKEKIIYIEDDSKFIKVLNAMFESGEEFKVEIYNDKVIGVRVL